MYLILINIILKKERPNTPFRQHGLGESAIAQLSQISLAALSQKLTIYNFPLPFYSAIFLLYR
jgi:hypothetical protein